MRMSPTVAGKLNDFAADADHIDNEAWADRWAMRVNSFLTQTLGADAARDFTNIQSPINFYDTLAMRRGHLEGLVAKDAEQEHSLAQKTQTHIEVSLTPEQLLGPVK